MVAYSFKPSFVEPIRLLEKRHTIRLPRKRHARPGEPLQLFTGPRMRPVRLGAAICDRVVQVRLHLRDDVVTLDDAVELRTEQELDEFAVRDGFNPGRRPALGPMRPWEYMSAWWRMTHPDHRIFAGVLIDWDDSFRPAAGVVASWADATLPPAELQDA